jgi:CYTH domain-containing protein
LRFLKKRCLSNFKTNEKVFLKVVSTDNWRSSCSASGRTVAGKRYYLADSQIATVRIRVQTADSNWLVRGLFATQNLTKRPDFFYSIAIRWTE